MKERIREKYDKSVQRTIQNLKENEGPSSHPVFSEMFPTILKNHVNYDEVDNFGRSIEGWSYSLHVVHNEKVWNWRTIGSLVMPDRHPTERRLHVGWRNDFNRPLKYVLKEGYHAGEDFVKSWIATFETGDRLSPHDSWVEYTSSKTVQTQIGPNEFQVRRTASPEFADHITQPVYEKLDQLARYIEDRGLV